jgi:uncharacterized protein with GYD domain
MPFYLHQWRYKDPEVRAMVLRPQQRVDVVRDAAHAFGGRLHSFYFCFGGYDGLAISEFPDNKTAIACLMSIVGAGGLASLRTTSLMASEEAEAAMKLANEIVARGGTPYTAPSGTGVT